MKKFLALILSVLFLVAGLPFTAFALDVVVGAAQELDGKYYSLGEVLYENDFEATTHQVLPEGWGVGFTSYSWVSSGTPTASAWHETWAPYKKYLTIGTNAHDGYISAPEINTRNYIFEAEVTVNCDNGGTIGIVNNMAGGIANSQAAVVSGIRLNTSTATHFTQTKGTGGITIDQTVTLPSANPVRAEMFKIKLISFEGKSYLYYNGELVSTYSNLYKENTSDYVGFFGCYSYFNVDNVVITALKVAEPTYTVDDKYFKMGEVLYENDFETSTHQVLPEGWEAGKPSYVWNNSGALTVRAWHNWDGKKFLSFGVGSSDGITSSPEINTRNYMFEADIIVDSGYIGVVNNMPGGVSGSTGATINRFSPSGNTSPNVVFSKGDAGVAEKAITLPTENPAKGETVKVMIISLEGSSYFYYNGTLVTSYSNAYPESETDCVGFFGCNSYFNVDNVVIKALEVVEPTYVLDGKEYTKGDVIYQNDFESSTHQVLPEGWAAGIPTYGWNHASGSVPTAYAYHETWSPYGKYLTVGTGGYDGYVSAPEINTRNYIFEADVTVNTANAATIGIVNNMAGGIANSQAAVVSGIRLNGSTDAHYTQTKGTGDITINQTLTLPSANPVNKELVKIKLISFEGKSYLYYNGDLISTYSNLYKENTSDYVGFFGCYSYFNVDNVVITAINIPGEEPEDTLEAVEIAGITAVKVAENVQDNNSYKVSFTMNASENASIGFFTADADSAATVGYVEGEDKAICAVEAGDTQGEAYITVDKKGGKNSAVGSDLYMYVIDGNVSELNVSEATAELLTDVSGEKPLIAQGGVSILAGVAEDKNQALRYYFNYDTIDGTEIVIDGELYEVKSRGFLITNGNVNADAKITRSTANGTSIKDINVTNLTNCWNVVANNDTLGSNNLCYSVHVLGFKPVNGTYNNRDSLYVKGYVVVEVNGVEYTLYSEEVNTTVSAVASLNYSVFS